MYKYFFIYLSIFLTFKCMECAPVGFFGAQPADMSVLEHNSGYDTYGHRQMQAAKVRGIKPIVDSIREEEKYGNDGSQHKIGQTIIKVSEGVASSITNALGTPNQNTYNILAPLSPIFTIIGERLGGI